MQLADPYTLEWLLNLPHIGVWSHDFLIRGDAGRPPNFGYLAAAAAAAAVRAGVPFELDVPVTDGRVLLPGLGHFHGIDQDSWARLRSDGERLTVGAFSQVPCAALVPDDGSAEPVPHWQGVHIARAVADGQTWTTLLETTDQYLNRFALPMATALSAEEVASWQACIQSAWEVLVRHHSSAASSIAAGVSVIVPLAARSDTDLGSATNPAAIGAIAASLPPDPVPMAEILVHEFQHLKLSALQDMVSLTEPCDERVYAPWRQDPRPVGGLLQGVYAFLGIARFWGAQRQAETEPDAILRAQVMFERCRSMIGQATATLLRTGCLTSLGTRFVTLLQDEGQRLGAATVPREAKAIARAVTLDHWLTWQLRHAAIDAVAVAELAAAYQEGEPLAGRALPEVRIEEETRKVVAATRSRMLTMRFLEPHRYRELSAAGLPGLGEADRLLVSEQPSLAVQAYRDEISAAAEPLPDALGRTRARDPLGAADSAPVRVRHPPAAHVRHARLFACPGHPERSAGAGSMVYVIPARHKAHSADWPLLDLDVAAVREAGDRPVPFRQFILKVHSRCNLSCSYCYVYEMADQGVAGDAQAHEPGGGHAKPSSALPSMPGHALASVDVILHGGEPLLAGRGLAGRPGRFAPRSSPAQVNVAVQTNGTLLDRPMLEALKQPERSASASAWTVTPKRPGGTAATPTAAAASMRSPTALTCSGRRSFGTATAASCARSISSNDPVTPTRRC